MCFGKPAQPPSAPAPVAAPAAPPKAVPPVSERSIDVQQAGRQARMDARQRKGFASTLLARQEPATSLRSAPNLEEKKTLLG